MHKHKVLRIERFDMDLPEVDVREIALQGNGDNIMEVVSNYTKKVCDMYNTDMTIVQQGNCSLVLSNFFAIRVSII